MKNKTKQLTKATKNRITALILALLLSLTVLSPTLPVKAQDITSDGADMTENNAEGGGHQTGTGGDGETSGGRPTGNDGSFEIMFHYKFKDGLRMRDYERNYSVFLKGDGHFNIRSLDLNITSAKAHEYRIYVFSDKPFTTNGSLRDTLDGELSVHENYVNSEYGMSLRSFGDNSFYYREISAGCVKENDEFISFNSPNKLALTSSVGITDKNIQNAITATLDLTKDDYKSDEDKANMTPVRDESIGYLPRARYFDNRRNNKNMKKVTSTIQWASFEEPYASDLDNPYYIEIYVDLHCLIAHEDEQNPELWITDNTPLEFRHHYKKYGEIKYVAERLEFSYSEPFDFYLPTANLGYNNCNVVFPQSYVSAFYVRLLHYDYDKQQVLCGGWTKLVPDANGGCTSETGDFPDDTPDDDDDFVPDDDDPKKWGDDGWEPDPNPDDPDNPNYPDFGIDTSSIGAFIVSAITSFLNAFKSILSLVGEFPELCKHVFSFLPDEVSILMFGGVTAIIIMRFLGR